MDESGAPTSQESDMAATNRQVEMEWFQNLPECAAEGCHKKVHCDPRLPEEMREFSYCSPLCRDTILEREKEYLHSEIKEMELKLESLKTVVVFPSNRKQTVSPTEKTDTKSTTKSSDKKTGSKQPLGSKSSASGTPGSKQQEPSTKQQGEY